MATYETDEVWAMFEIEMQTWPPKNPDDFHMGGPDNKYTCKKCRKEFIIRPQSNHNMDAEFQVLSRHVDNKHGLLSELLQRIEALEKDTLMQRIARENL